ncbi:MAG: hypothetical protein U9O90_10235 [Euryarchaeota archaeon]|nr:hypothetical protein [Euryarchaeota archaeon]
MKKRMQKLFLSKIEATVRRNPEIKVKIPFIVVGELINNIIRENVGQKDRDEITHKFFELREARNADIIPPNKCYYNKAKLLIDRDRYLVEHAPTATFIVSCALYDQDSLGEWLTKHSWVLWAFSCSSPGSIL